MKHIIVVDDDSQFRKLLIDYLSKHAFRVTGVTDSHQLWQVLQTERVDLLIVDLNLGHEDGLEIIRTLPAKSDAPIIIISGDRLEENDKVVGLELGASDYVTKPFPLREFLARVRAAMRARTAPTDGKCRRIYRFDAWTLNVRKRHLILNEEIEVRLSTRELNLLIAFLDYPKQLLSREQLLSLSRVHDEEVFDRSIDTLILRLRRKLETDPSNPKLICTERGVGYKFDADVTVEERRRPK